MEWATMGDKDRRGDAHLIDEDELTVHQRDRHGLPLNAEVKAGQVADSFITPTKALFHRNHDDIVEVPRNVKAVEEEWKVAISVGEDVIASTSTSVEWKQQAPTLLAYGSLLHDTTLERTRATATLECAGNRREDLAAQGEKAEGIQWSAGAISTARWYGPALRSLLLQLNVPDPFGHHDEAARARLVPSDSKAEQDCAPWARPLHLHMLSAQPTSESDKPGTGEFFGASIPLSTAMHPQQQCILATHQNGDVLTQPHGFPVRVVVPGHVGARWVKWLRGLHISTEPEQSPPMRLDYKLLTPPRDASTKEREEWKARVMGEEKDLEIRKRELRDKQPMQALGVGSHIQNPADGERISSPVAPYTVEANGYAVGQDGSPVTVVEVLLLQQESREESVPSIRRRAAQTPANQWTQASVTSESDTDEMDMTSFAWSLWHCNVSAGADAKEKDSLFALVARATTASGIKQEQESPWNVRGFSTRSWPVVRDLSLAS